MLAQAQAQAEQGEAEGKRRNADGDGNGDDDDHLLRGTFPPSTDQQCTCLLQLERYRLKWPGPAGAEAAPATGNCDL